MESDREDDLKKTKKKMKQIRVEKEQIKQKHANLELTIVDIKGRSTYNS